MSTSVISTQNINKSFPGHNGGVLPVLQDINITVREEEVVALLGKSGSGKSTLLRHIAGLLAPSSGLVRYRGKPVEGPNPGTAMLFQSFALMPWLTVQQNVELGLRARGILPRERALRALQAIDMVGLDGFENAYPKELSGGMRQRVGFARALVVEPDVLLMDEPFSALDVLTAQTLRTELTDLLTHPDSPTRTAVLVTHNIEEAVQLADRILVLDANPGRIKAEIYVQLPRPRDRDTVDFTAVVNETYEALTGERGTPPTRPMNAGDHLLSAGAPIPSATVESLAGLLEFLDTRGGSLELAPLANALSYEIDDLMPVVEAAQLLGYAKIAANCLKLTASGRAFTRTDILPRKQLFAGAALANVPLMATIRTLLLASGNRRIPESYVIDRLCGNFTDHTAHQQLNTAIAWGRYAELYEYDADDRVLLLPPGSAGR
ncbi:nitrate/sulfonate/bicarbonate ABC transporter ATP-binding protein [Streptomyces gamaensis]|uniref:Nitrate/sulfonate/bicarbonate ABC transporter ATP-binding protein n=1 Tax=Streptomyces gamaensis TaxID=1763542 RepID=A0ABW0Z8G1_9ACTN